MVCLDTSVLIDYLKGDKGIINLVKSYAEEDTIATTAVTEYELLKHRDEIKRGLAQELLSSIEIYAFDRKAAEESSKIYRDLRMQGKEINENDILIAGIALSNNEFLVTRDADFSNIAEPGRIRIV
jgi:tRNA(fMet)-specific endonuclease VapC